MVQGSYLDKDGSVVQIEGNTAKKIITMPDAQVKKQRNNIEIPQFMQRKENCRWYYLNMEEHDAAVIQAERKRVAEIRRKKEIKKQKAKQKAISNFIYYAKQKLTGLAIVSLTIYLCISGVLVDVSTGINDCTFALITFPLGLYFMFTKEKCFLDYSERYED